MFLIGHLRKDGLGNVIVAAPIGSPLSVRELVYVMASKFARETRAFSVHRGGALDEVALTSITRDLCHLLGCRGARHDRDETQPEHPREVGFGNGSRATRSLNDGRLRTDPAVAEAVKEKRARQPMLEAAGRMCGLVFEVEGNVRKAGQWHA